jgi:mannose-6-phosphate isomerase-like protein (cupin superfamily)
MRAIATNAESTSRATYGLGFHMDVVNLAAAPPFTTKDGSEIRELLAHRNSAIRNQSLAEARVAPGGRTTAHYHKVTEEIYYILRGSGEMTIGDQSRRVAPGDAIAIPPGEVHTIANPGSEPLVFLCCCAPCYDHEDTFLIE